MTTEILRRGDDLTPLPLLHDAVRAARDATTTPVSQADGTGHHVICVNGCGLPMQQVDRHGIAYRCGACAEITIDRSRIDLIEREATSTLDRALFELLSVRTMLAGAMMGSVIIDATIVMASLNSTIGLLTSAPAQAYADTIHTAAIGEATRICARRSESLFTDSHNPIAGNEAAKCAFAVNRIRERSALNAKSESSIVFPEAAHA